MISQRKQHECTRNAPHATDRYFENSYALGGHIAEEKAERGTRRLANSKAMLPVDWGDRRVDCGGDSRSNAKGRTRTLSQHDLTAAALLSSVLPRVVYVKKREDHFIDLHLQTATRAASRVLSGISSDPNPLN